jgi:hypothetical protein
MRRGRFLTGFIAASAVVLITAAGALSATPRQIYSDLAQHGKLTKSYSAADLQRAAKDATVEGYGGVGAQTYQPVIQQAAGVAGAHYSCAHPAPGTVAGAGGTAATGGHVCRTSQVLGASVAPTQAGTLPFTGIQLGVFVALGLALLAGGMLLRRSGRDGSSA